MSQDVTRQAWQQQGMERLDAERWLHPSEQSLLTLAAVRAEEEVLLDEHYRSLPPIISFSNERWYDAKLRIMTDVRHKRFGHPDQPIMQLHRVPDGVISNGSQENEAEARALIEHLTHLVTNPDYAGATIGVMCLFEEQVDLVQDLVRERVSPREWEEHALVVINPDGFQGDERDVILYSLSYDAHNMPQSAISARMSDQAHVQGMLNVAFTRARDEVHVFHSAPIEAFAFADGRPGALTDWLRHCSGMQATPRAAVAGARLGRVDSQFEEDVAAGLRELGLRVFHQYPACGFHIDLVVERAADDVRVAVECDGERYHLDEHGELNTEDIERQAIVERAGWRVVRIPYRKWLADPGSQLARVVAALDELTSAEERDRDAESNGDDRPVYRAKPADPAEAAAVVVASPATRGQRELVSREQVALLDALKEGRAMEEDVFLRARDLLGSQRLTQKLRQTLQRASSDLARRKLVTIEDGEYFVLPPGREAALAISDLRAHDHRRRVPRRW